jgi:hypothetical protein
LVRISRSDGRLIESLPQCRIIIAASENSLSTHRPALNSQELETSGKSIKYILQDF